MIRKFYSYTTFPIDALILSPPTGTRGIINKPEGGSIFWASGQIEAGGEIFTHWDEYVFYSGNREKWKYVIEVQPDWANILIIDSAYEYIELFNTNPEYFIRMEYRNLLHLNFKRIARDYDGIFLSQECVNDLRFVEGDEAFNKFESLYGYDVETLAIWGDGAIRGLKMYHVDPSRFDEFDRMHNL